MSQVPASDLVSSEEIAQRANYAHHQSVNNLWRRHRGAPDPFPDPETEIGGRRLWAWSKVRPWLERNGRWPPPAEPIDEP